MPDLYGSGGNQPSADKNQESTQTITPDLEGKTPEFLQQLLDDLDEVRSELGLLFAQMFPPAQTFGVQMLEDEKQQIINRKRMEELEEKEYQLRAEIKKLSTLIWPESSNALQGLGVES